MLVSLENLPEGDRVCDFVIDATTSYGTKGCCENSYQSCRAIVGAVFAG